jgi:hypothetical protein
VDPGAADPTTVGTWDVEGGPQHHGTAGLEPRDFQSRRSRQIDRTLRKDGTKGASLFYAQLPDGKRLYHDICWPETEGATARKILRAAQGN